jgi:hypothetical protein
MRTGGRGPEKYEEHMSYEEHMNTVNLQPRDATRVPPVPMGRRYMVFGGPAPDISGLNLLNLEGVVGADCDGIILLKHINPLELTNALAESPDPAVPVADFFGNHPVRRDFIGSLLNDESAKEMGQRFASIWRRLEELPYRAAPQDRTAMTILRLLYSRDAPAKASFYPDYPLTVQYQLVGTGAGVRQHLETLADLELLQRRHFMRTHACNKCGSARQQVYEACPGCGSADIAEEVIVHHYRCGCQRAESYFIQGNLLICPKCRRELKHLGVDYGKPGKICVCRACGVASSEPSSRFVCMDCYTATPAETAPTTDWYHYDLTELGLGRLRMGQLPQSEFPPFSEKGQRAYSPHEFQLLAMQETRVARQYRQAFSIARISFPNLQAIRSQLGILATDAALRRAVDAIVQTVRASDFVGVCNDRTSVIVGFPGTTAAAVRPLEDRIRQILHDTIETPLEFAIEIAESDAAVAMLARG